MLPQTEGFIGHLCSFAHVQHHPIWAQLIGSLRPRQQNQFQTTFLEIPCRSAYCRGLEDALKANPPMDPNNQEYLRSYYSLMMPLSQQWMAA